ncbi:MAG: transcription termination/antitermination NusG family protein [Planctomycetota bacterium]
MDSVAEHLRALADSGGALPAGRRAADAVPLAAPGNWIVTAPGAWWVAHTRPRQEKRVADALAAAGVRQYLPLVPVRHSYAKSRVVFHLPLFPGYVFFVGDHGACDCVRRTHRIAGILPVADQAGLRRELVQIERALAGGKHLELFSALKVGCRCRIRSGPLRDVEGVVVQQGRRYRMYLSVTILAQSAVVEVDVGLLELVD